MKVQIEFTRNTSNDSNSYIYKDFYAYLPKDLFFGVHKVSQTKYNLKIKITENLEFSIHYETLERAKIAADIVKNAILKAIYSTSLYCIRILGSDDNVKIYLEFTHNNCAYSQCIYIPYQTGYAVVNNPEPCTLDGPIEKKSFVDGLLDIVFKNWDADNLPDFIFVGVDYDIFYEKDNKLKRRELINYYNCCRILQDELKCLPITVMQVPEDTDIELAKDCCIEDFYDEAMPTFFTRNFSNINTDMHLYSKFISEIHEAGYDDSVLDEDV